MLAPLLDRLRTIMGNPTPQLRTHNIVWVPMDSPQQSWHYDDRSTKELKHHRYFTILVGVFVLAISAEDNLTL